MKKQQQNAQSMNHQTMEEKQELTDVDIPKKEQPTPGIRHPDVINVFKPNKTMYTD